MSIYFDEDMMIAMARVRGMDEGTWAEVFVISLGVFNETQ